MENNTLKTWRVGNTMFHDKLIQSVRDFPKCTVLLDLTKPKYTLIEKFVYDTAMFHLTQHNFYDIENIEIEFWCKQMGRNRSLHVDCDERDKRNGILVYPLLSCVTYLNDTLNCPTILTNINMDCYTSKFFKTQREVLLSLPIRNKQITFDGSFFHGSTTLCETQDIYERYIIAINFWNRKPNAVEYYNFNQDSEESFARDNKYFDIHTDNLDICSVNVPNNIINYDLFNDIMYNKKIDTCYRFNEIINTVRVKSNPIPDTFKFTLDDSIGK